VIATMGLLVVLTLLGAEDAENCEV